MMRLTDHLSCLHRNAGFPRSARWRSQGQNHAKSNLALRTFATAVLLGIALHPAAAQSLALAPAEVQYKFKPGKPFRFNLSVSNDGAAPVVMRASVTDLWYNEKNEKVFGRPGSSPRSAANWIEVVPPRITVPAGQTGAVNVIITPPAQVSGGYYAVVFLESKPELALAASGEKNPVYTNIRLGSLILLTTENTEQYGMEVSDLQVTPPDANHAFRLAFQLHNGGNTHVFPETRVAILNSNHELVAKAEAEIKRFFPGQKTEVSASWAGILPNGQYTAVLTVAYGPEKIHTTDLPFTVSNPQLLQIAGAPR